MKAHKILAENTRAFKTEQGYTITVGSVDVSTKKIEHDGHTFEIVTGEFAPYLEETVFYLKKALKYVANETQHKMLEKYIESYTTGSTEAHKDSQRKWVVDIGPAVETNMGWIETYIDPENKRGYWEGLVAIVDKDKSKKF